MTYDVDKNNASEMPKQIQSDTNGSDIKQVFICILNIKYMFIKYNTVSYLFSWIAVIIGLQESFFEVYMSRASNSIGCFADGY